VGLRRRDSQFLDGSYRAEAAFINILRSPNSIRFGPEPLLLVLIVQLTKPGESSVEENRWTFFSQLRGN
jgi:hypothetical protein